MHIDRIRKNQLTVTSCRCVERRGVTVVLRFVPERHRRLLRLQRHGTHLSVHINPETHYTSDDESKYSNMPFPWCFGGCGTPSGQPSSGAAMTECTHLAIVGIRVALLTVMMATVTRQDDVISPTCCGQVAYADCLHRCTLEQLCKLDALCQYLPPPFRSPASLFADPSLNAVPPPAPRLLCVRQALSLV